MPLTFDFDVNGIVLTGKYSREEIRWEGCAGSLETPQQFLFYVSPGMLHVVPKRAFANAEDVSAMSRLLESVFGRPTGGFPVQPIRANTRSSKAGLSILLQGS